MMEKKRSFRLYSGPIDGNSVAACRVLYYYFGAPWAIAA